MSESRVELCTQEERRIHKCWLTTKYLFGRETFFEISKEFQPNFPFAKRELHHICIRVFTSNLSFSTTEEFSFYISLHSERGKLAFFFSPSLSDSLKKCINERTLKDILFGKDISPLAELCRRKSHRR